MDNQEKELRKINKALKLNTVLSYISFAATLSSLGIAIALAPIGLVALPLSLLSFGSYVYLDKEQQNLLSKVPRPEAPNKLDDYLIRTDGDMLYYRRQEPNNNNKFQDSVLKGREDVNNAHAR